MKQPQKSSQSDRLNELCDFLQVSGHYHPYRAKSWDELIEENEKLRSETKQIVAGAIYDFAAWLTTREEPITLSSSHDTAPAILAISEFIVMRGLEDVHPLVTKWQEYIKND